MQTNNETFNALCPACGEGRLEQRCEELLVEHAGHRGAVLNRYAVCDLCGSEITAAADALANKRAMIAFRKDAEGLLSGAAVRDFRQRLGLTQALAAQLFGGGKVGFSRYENDDIAQSEAMDSLIRLCVHNPGNLLLLASHKQQALPVGVIARIQDRLDQQWSRLLPDIRKKLDQRLGARHEETPPSQRRIVQVRFGAPSRGQLEFREPWGKAA